MPKIINFGKFLKNWSLRSNSVIKQKKPKQANKHSSLRSQNCEMRLFEWLFQQHRAQQGLCKFREVNKYHLAEAEAVETERRKKMEAPVNRLCSCFFYAICKAPFDNWSFSSWKSFLSSNGRNEASALLLLHLPTLFENYLKCRNKNNSNFGNLHQFCVIKSDPSGKTTIFGILN